MNKFRKLGFIEYNGRIRVHKALLNVILHDQLPTDGPVTAPLMDLSQGQFRMPRRNSVA